MRLKPIVGNTYPITRFRIHYLDVFTFIEPATNVFRTLTRVPLDSNQNTFLRRVVSHRNFKYLFNKTHF